MQERLVSLIPTALSIGTFDELVFGLPLALFHGVLRDEKKHPW